MYNPQTNLRFGPLTNPPVAAPSMRNCLDFFYFLVFVLSFFWWKIKDPCNDVGSAALEVVANNWKSLYSAEICCFQIFHRFATKYLKAYTMLRWTALKFVAAPRKGTVLDPGFSSVSKKLQFALTRWDVMLFSKTLIKDVQMSSETGIQDVCVLIKDMQMSSETGI